MQIERLEPLKQNEVRDFYFRYLQMPFPANEPDHVPHTVNPQIEDVKEINAAMEDDPVGYVIFHDDNSVEVVDVRTGEHIRLILDEVKADAETEKRTKALIQVALVDSKWLSKGLADTISWIEQKKYINALGTFAGLEYRFQFVKSILETATNFYLRS